ncbi:Uncharacterised protein [Flavonifractor plautii]|uniref:Uncharacterized protein n=1 Tax=Flavonifractor plautii TaxID=292800 RepID=A0A174NJ03_FLAPL|nr:Uncharacterised protein [Flavonifractor plautii]
MWGRLAALAALCGRLRVLPCRGGLGVPLALLRALFGAGTLLRPLPLWGGCFRLPVRFLVQHTLEDLVGPIQFGHRQDHVDQLPPAIPIPDGGEQQLLLSRPVLKFLVLLRGHGELPEIPCLPQHLPQVDFPGELLMVPGKGQGKGQQVLQGRAGQPNDHLRPGQQHTHHLVGRLTASYVHWFSPRFHALLLCRFPAPSGAGCFGSSGTGPTSSAPPGSAG